MSHLKEKKIATKDRLVFAYTGISPQDVENAIDSILIQNGYIHSGGGIYTKGSRTMRLLFGAFCKYYQFKITLDASNPDEILIGISSLSSGMSGGVIGMNQVTKELGTLRVSLEAI